MYSNLISRYKETQVMKYKAYIEFKSMQVVFAVCAKTSSPHFLTALSRVQKQTNNNFNLTNINNIYLK